MGSNGCGKLGTLTKLHRLLWRKPLPYESCCDEHDLGYEQMTSPEERKWLDQRFRECLAEKGYKVTGAVFYYLVRWFGGIGHKYTDN